MSSIAKSKASSLRGEIKHQEVVISMIRGIMIDDLVTEKEIRGLVDFLESNPQLTESYPGNIVLENCKKFLSNNLGVPIANFFREVVADEIKVSTRFPIDDILEINFEDRLFCFTGKFEFGTREKCHRTTLSIGGKVSDDINLNLNYLVIGKYSNPDWIATSHGRKIEKAMEYKKHPKSGVLIVAEQFWIDELKRKHNIKK